MRKWYFRTNKRGMDETCIKCKKFISNYYKCESCDIIICVLCSMLQQYGFNPDFTKKIIEDLYPHFDIEIKGVKL